MPLPRNVIPDFILKKLSKIQKIPLLNKFSNSSIKNPTAEEITGFRKAQRLAYQCAIDIAKEIRPGWTESQTAALMDTYLRDHGVKNFFHKSFAWFGDRSGFAGIKKYWDFMPKENKLKEEDVIVLDTAPIVEGYTGDIGFTFAIQPNKDLVTARTLLLQMRKDLLLMFKNKIPANEIWKKVDDQIKENNFINCYTQYPFSVLGHRVHNIKNDWIPGMTIPFSIHSYWYLLSRGLVPELLGPWHEGNTLGMWAIEPHLGTNVFGAKFEEIIVVTDTTAFWIDEEVPHLNLPKGLY